MCHDRVLERTLNHLAGPLVCSVANVSERKGRGDTISLVTTAFHSDQTAGIQQALGPRTQVLNDFLGSEIARLESLHLGAPKRPPADEMDRFLRAALQRTWQE